MVEENVAVISTYGATDNFYKLLCAMGYLMPQRFKIFYVFYAVFVIGYSTFYMPFAFTMAIWMSDSLSVDLSAFFTTLQVTFDIYGGTSKILFIGVMLHKLHGTRAIIQKLDERCKGDDEIEEQKRLVQQGRKIVVTTLTLYLSYSLSTCLGAIVKGRPLYAIYFPFINWRNSRWELNLQTVLEFILMNLGCIQQATNDSYATVYVCILRSHMRILIMRIKKLGKNPNLNPSGNVQELIMCIKDHKTILNLHHQIRPIISVTVFIQFSLTAIMMGTTMINVMLFSTDFSLRLGSCLFLAAVVVQSFPLCYFAQGLLDESSKLDKALFHSQWFEQSLEYRKILIYFMHRSQSLMEFNAAKLFPITMSSFVKIAKFSFTLYTFIQKMYVK